MFGMRFSSSTVMTNELWSLRLTAVLIVRLPAESGSAASRAKSFAVVDLLKIG